MKEKTGESTTGEEMIHDSLALVSNKGDILLEKLKVIDPTMSVFSVDNVGLTFEQLKSLSETQNIVVEENSSEEAYTIVGASMKKILNVYFNEKKISAVKLFYKDTSVVAELNNREVDLDNLMIVWTQQNKSNVNVIGEAEGILIPLRAVYKGNDGKWHYLDMTNVTTEAADFTYDGRGMSIAELKAKSEAVTTDADFVMKKKGNSQNKNSLDRKSVV